MDNNIQFGGASHDIKNYDNGIIRKKQNDNFIYSYGSTNEKISKKDLKRILLLKIPPKWENVWISTDDKSKIQAIGTDSKERKQYIYHFAHIEKAEIKKFLKLYEFIKAFPILQKAMNKDAKLPPYDKDKIIATMLTMVRDLHIRAGKEEYAKDNKSYGISSLKKTHVKIKNDIIYLKFKGKSKKNLSFIYNNQNIKNHLLILLKMEGEKLFQYIDNGKIKQINYMDLNHYIQDKIGKQFSVKDFRTYAANYYFVKNLLLETKKRQPKTDKIINKNIQKALDVTANNLRHTKSISKKSYVMDFVVNYYSTHINYFIKRIDNNIDLVLLDLLKKYKKNL